METNEQISGLALVINDLSQRIDEMKEAISASATPLPNMEEKLKKITCELKVRKQSLNLLKRQHDQHMLSGMVREGIKNEETMKWWANRY